MFIAERGDSTTEYFPLDTSQAVIECPRVMCCFLQGKAIDIVDLGLSSSGAAESTRGNHDSFVNSRIVTLGMESFHKRHANWPRVILAFDRRHNGSDRRLSNEKHVVLAPFPSLPVDQVCGGLDRRMRIS